MGRTDRGRRPGAPVLAAGLIALAVALAVVLGGCGYSRTPVPSVTRPQMPHGYKPVGSRKYDFALLAPQNWAYLTSQVTKPVVMIKASGSAVIAVSWYRRTTTPPVDASELDADETALIGAIRARQKDVSITAHRTLTISGAPAIQLQADERISGIERRVLSTHVLLAHSELVLEEYAPPKVFAQLRKAFEYVAGHFALLHAVS